MNIGIDIDDTISNTYEEMFNDAQKFTIEDLEREINITNKDATTHMYTTVYHNWSEEDETNFWNKYYKSIIENTKPRKYAVDVINKLKEDGHKIFLITARFTVDFLDVEEITKKWLEDNKINYDELILNAEDKVKCAKEKNIDVFIDDSIKNCEAMANSEIKTYIMNTMINCNYENKKIERLYSWPHIYQEITKLSKEN